MQILLAFDSFIKNCNQGYSTEIAERWNSIAGKNLGTDVYNLKKKAKINLVCLKIKYQRL